MFGRGNRVPAGRVHHDDAAPRRRFDIDVIDSDARAADDAQPRRRIQHCARHFCLAANDDRAEIRNDFDELRFAQTGLASETSSAPSRGKFIDASLRNGISNQYFGRIHSDLTVDDAAGWSPATVARRW